MKSDIQIVDRGRGPQLSSSRITVQDLVPYFQRQWTHDQILAIMPVLSSEEIQVVEQYVKDNFESVMEQDRRLRELQTNRRNPPEIEDIARRGGEKMAALREDFKKKKAVELNGDHAAPVTFRSQAMDQPDRRDFLHSVGAVAAAPALGLLAVSAADAQVAKNPTQESARLLTEVLRVRHAKHLDEADFKGLQQKIAGNLSTAEALKRFTLKNSDEPDFVFFAEVTT